MRHVQRATCNVLRADVLRADVRRATCDVLQDTWLEATGAVIITLKGDT